MNTEDLINDFIDGCLEPELETEFFSLLHENDEMKTQLRNQLIIKNQISANKDKFLPSSSSVNNIFSTIGIPVVTDIPLANGLSQKKPINYRKLRYTAYVASIAATITFLICLLLFYDSSEIVTADMAVNYFRSGNILSNDLNFNKTKPEIVYRYISRKNDDVSSNKIIAETDLISQPKENDKIHNLKPIDFDNNIDKISDLKDLSESISIGQKTITDLSDEIPYPGTEELPALNSGSKDTKISFEVGGFYSFNFVQQGNSNGNENPFKNPNIAVLYKLNRFKIGGEIRRESYYQQFASLNYSADRKSVMEEQYTADPTFTSFSALSRFSILENGIFLPYIELAMGGNTVGLVSRAGFGIELIPIAGFSLYGAAEFSGLIYKFRQDFYNASKVSFKYGLIYNF